MRIVQVVRRFGACGGMEEYAYQLSFELKKLGVDVKVVCEKVSNAQLGSNIETIELGESLNKPRWFAHLIFSRKLKRWVKDNPHPCTIIHSHERVDCHHVTTIHSTLYNFPKRKRLTGLRAMMNERIEKKEMASQSVKKIIPVSNLISAQIKDKYSFLSDRLSDPICPGSAPMKITRNILNPDSPIIGFMGKEWKRKGLPKVLAIFRDMKLKISKLRLCIAGFPKEEIIGLVDEKEEDIEVIGQVDRKEDFYSKIDLLLHPAKQEAYGMVIAEALSLGIPVLCSSESGASEIIPDKQNVISHEKEVHHWSNRLNLMISDLRNSSSCKTKVKTWNEVAIDYLHQYKMILSDD